MVDALVSGASAERRVGSSPILGTSDCLLGNRFFRARIGLVQSGASRVTYLRDVTNVQSCYATTIID